MQKGAYIVHGGDEKPDAIVLATGANKQLAASSIPVMSFNFRLHACAWCHP